MKPSINTLTCNCQNKEACPLNGQCQIEEVASENTLSSNQPNYKKKKVFWDCERVFQEALIQPEYIFQKWILQKRYRAFWGNLANQNEELHLGNNLKYYHKLPTYSIYNSKKCYLCFNNKLETAPYEGENHFISKFISKETIIL